MKILFTSCLLFCCFLLTAQPGGYSRDGAAATLKYTETLFDKPFLFAKGSVNIPGDKADNKPAVLEALAESDKVIKEYEAKITEFLATKPTAVVLKNKYSSVTSKADALSSAIEKAAEGYNEWRTLSSVCFLQELYLYQAFIAGAVRVYPEAISLQEKQEQVDEAIRKYGSREDYMAKLEKNQLDYVKNLRMKKAVFSDPALEKMAKQNYESTQGAHLLTVTNVHITSNWTIEKNILDIPLHKEVEVNFAIRKKDGSCAFAAAYIRCTYEGGGRYGAPWLLMPGAPVTVPCENLPKPVLSL